MSEAYLTLRGVGKSFGRGASRHEVLRDVNLEVKKGEFVAIVGYSGSGKTTLMSLMSGLQHPDQGEVYFQGKPVTGPGPERGVVFQNYSLLPWLTVFENILLAVDQVYPTWSREEKKDHVEASIAKVSLSHARDRRPHQLSGGMRQRVAVARALAMNPEVLLMDEPLSALDALTRGALQDEFERIWRQDRITVVMVTNHVDEALLLADRIVPLTPGPQATLGESFAVDLARPRDRKEMNHDRTFQELRGEIIDYLVEQRKIRNRAPVYQPVDLLPQMPEVVPVATAS